MGSRGTYLGTPKGKIPQELKESLQMKAEERGDIKRGTPGFWVTNEVGRPLYIPGWLVVAEEALKSYNGPELVVKIGPFWSAE